MEKQIAQLRVERDRLEEAEGLARLGRTVGLVEGSMGVVFSFSEWGLIGVCMVGMGFWLVWFETRAMRRAQGQVIALNERIMELRQRLREKR